MALAACDGKHLPLHPLDKGKELLILVPTDRLEVGKDEEDTDSETLLLLGFVIEF